MAINIARRKFIAALGGAAFAWPQAARAQQADRMRRVGMLETRAADDPEEQTRRAVFMRGYKSLAGLTGTTCGSITVWLRPMWIALANTLRNWWLSRRT
jgi:hypothetical protein